MGSRCADPLELDFAMPVSILAAAFRSPRRFVRDSSTRQAPKLVVIGLSVAVTFGAAACQGSVASEPKSKAAAPALTSGTELEAYLPLVNNNVLQFRTEDQSGNIETLLAKVVRTTGGSAELKIGDTRHVFDYLADAIRLRSKDVVYLQKPIAVGTRWPGEHGCTASIASVSRTVDVPAGHFERCVEVVEPCNDAVVAATYTTVLCPGAGIALLEVKKGAKLMRASLVSNAPPVDLGQDSVRRIQ